MNASKDELASVQEVALALRALSAADLARLEIYAKYRTRGLPWLDPQDLFNDAVTRAMGGERRWPKLISLVTFLRETMRSIAHEELRRRIEGPVISQAELASEQSDEPSAFENVADPRPGPERQLAASQALHAIYHAFEDDSTALAILAGLAEGLTPDEICEKATIHRTAYETAQKRIRRRLARARAVDVKGTIQ